MLLLFGLLYVRILCHRQRTTVTKTPSTTSEKRYSNIITSSIRNSSPAPSEAIIAESAPSEAFSAEPSQSATSVTVNNFPSPMFASLSLKRKIEETLTELSVPEKEEFCLAQKQLVNVLKRENLKCQFLK
jgi:hypothetical protein